MPIILQPILSVVCHHLILLLCLVVHSLVFVRFDLMGQQCWSREVSILESSVLLRHGILTGAMGHVHSCEILPSGKTALQVLAWKRRLNVHDMYWSLWSTPRAMMVFLQAVSLLSISLLLGPSAYDWFEFLLCYLFIFYLLCNQIYLCCRCII